MAPPRDWVSERTNYPRHVAQLDLALEVRWRRRQCRFDWPRPKNNVSTYVSADGAAMSDRSFESHRQGRRRRRVLRAAIGNMSPVSLVWHKQRFDGGQSMSVLPWYFRHQLILLLPGRHQPRCQDTGPCFRSSYTRARVGPLSGYLSADRSRWLLCFVVSACRTASGPARRFQSIPIRAAHIGALSYCGRDRDGP